MEHFHGKDMKEYCSFFAGGKADDLYIPHSVEEVHSEKREETTIYWGKVPIC